MLKFIKVSSVNCLYPFESQWDYSSCSLASNVIMNLVGTNGCSWCSTCFNWTRKHWSGMLQSLSTFSIDPSMVHRLAFWFFFFTRLIYLTKHIMQANAFYEQTKFEGGILSLSPWLLCFSEEIASHSWGKLWCSWGKSLFLITVFSEGISSHSWGKFYDVAGAKVFEIASVV